MPINSVEAVMIIVTCVFSTLPVPIAIGTLIILTSSPLGQCLSTAGPWHQLYRAPVLWKKNLPGCGLTKVERQIRLYLKVGHDSLFSYSLIILSLDAVRSELLTSLYKPQINSLA
jgi:hypothetical protein